MARDHQQVNFRLPADLHDRLKQEAASNHRSVTAELVARLESSFEAPATPLFNQEILGVALNVLLELAEGRLQVSPLGPTKDEVVHAAVHVLRAQAERTKKPTLTRPSAPAEPATATKSGEPTLKRPKSPDRSVTTRTVLRRPKS